MWLWKPCEVSPSSVHDPLGCGVSPSSAPSSVHDPLGSMGSVSRKRKEMGVAGRGGEIGVAGRGDRCGWERR